MSVSLTAVAVIALFVFASCAGMRPKQAEDDPNFLGDFDPIRLENVMALRSVLGKLKPTEIRLYFVPRTNVVEAHFRDSANAVVLMFTAEQRRTLAEGIELYAKNYADYAAGNRAAMPERKPGRKNAFNRGKLSIAWGVVSTGRTAHTEFRTNYEYLEKGKPYFMLTAESGDSSEDSAVQSPRTDLYFSPAQLEVLLQVTDQDALQAEVDTLKEKAFAF